MESKENKPKMEKKKLPIRLVDVNRIVKSTPGIDPKKPVDRDALVLMSKATELFAKKFIQDCRAKSNPKRLKYEHFVDLAQEEGGKYNFLKQIIPKKITVKEYREIMAKKEAERKNEANY